MGVAQKLLQYQERWVTNKGYKEIEVKSMNQYPEMLHFLIKNQYHIYGVEDSEHGTKILFQKLLDAQ